MQRHEISPMLELLECLKRLTADCRPSMHEPDDQDIQGHVIGSGFDNATCAHLLDPNPPKGINLTLVLRRDDKHGLNIALADLVALARCADPAKVAEIDGN